MQEFKAQDYTIETLGKLYRCPACDRIYKHSSTRSEHMRAHHPTVRFQSNRKKEFPCLKCEKVCKSRFILRRHLIITHNVDGNRKHCKVCDVYFENEYNLKTHEKSKKHLKEVSMVCP